MIRKKIMRATTDSNPAVDFDQWVRAFATSAIFQAFTGWSDRDTRRTSTGMRYGDLKKQVAEAVVAALEPIQKRYREIMAETGLRREQCCTRRRRARHAHRQRTR